MMWKDIEFRLHQLCHFSSGKQGPVYLGQEISPHVVTLEVEGGVARLNEVVY